MILSPQRIRRLQILDPFIEGTKQYGVSAGLSHAGYDLRLAQGIRLQPGAFSLASTLERFRMPTDILGIVHDKSTWARKGLSVFNTVIEPGWTGYLTLELANHGTEVLELPEAVGICQVIFHVMTEPTEREYRGKYHDAPQEPQEAVFEH